MNQHRKQRENKEAGQTQKNKRLEKRKRKAGRGSSWVVWEGIVAFTSLLAKTDQLPLPFHLPDDVLFHCPLAQESILGFMVRVTFLVVTTNMLHSIVPTPDSNEPLSTETTGALGRWLALFMPATSPNRFKALLEVIALFLSFGLLAVASDPGSMHATLVLGEEILSVEVIHKMCLVE